jgi:hypothetical protein
LQIVGPFCVFARQARVAGTSGTSTVRVLSYQDFPKLQALGAEFLENKEVVIVWGGICPNSAAEPICHAFFSH